jgi:hypothetical protein
MTKRPKSSLNNGPNARPKDKPNQRQHTPLIKLIGKYASLSASLLFTGILFACASTPPSATLPQSKVAFSSVDHANYRKHVGSDVDAVNAKLNQAESLAAEKKHTPAEHLAQQILVDVELIQIKTQRLNVDQEVTQIENSISNLNQELKWREPVQLSPLNQ